MAITKNKNSKNKEGLAEKVKKKIKAGKKQVMDAACSTVCGSKKNTSTKSPAKKTTAKKAATKKKPAAKPTKR